MDFECEVNKNDEEEWAQVAARLPLSDGLAMHSQVSDPPYVTIHYNDIYHTLQSITMRSTIRYKHPPYATIHYNDIYHALQSYFVRETHDVLYLNKCLFCPLILSASKLAQLMTGLVVLAKSAR